MQAKMADTKPSQQALETENISTIPERETKEVSSPSSNDETATRPLPVDDPAEKISASTIMAVFVSINTNPEF